MSKDENRTPQRRRRAGGPPGSRAARPVEKAKDFKGTLRRLIKYLGQYKLMMLIVFILAALSTVFTVISPKIMGMAITKLMEGATDKLNGVIGAEIDYSYIGKILFLLGALYLAAAIFSYLQRYLMSGITQKIVYTLREDVDKKLSKLPLKYYDENQTGEILSRITNDVDTISSTLQQTITQMITSIVTVIGIAVMMVSISIPMTFFTVLVVPLGALATKGIAKKSQGYFIKQSKTLGGLNGHIEEMYSGHKIIKAYGKEEKSIEEFKNINEKLFQASHMAQFISGIIRPIIKLLNNISYVFVAVVGSIFVINGRITIGEVQAFMQYSKQFTQPIIQAADIANTIQSTIASAERVFQVLDEEEENVIPTDFRKKQDVKGKVEFQNVNFSYVKDEELIVDMNLKTKPGDTIAIVGPTGAGKTTLVNLLMRFYDIDSGKIIIDNVDIMDMSREQLRAMFGMVLQDTWLFNGTVKENIAYGKEDATDEEICEAAKLSQADFFIRTLKDGYDTILGENGVSISQGEMQLLTIARAILSDPDIMILDEATSSVDTRTELLIQKGMNRIMKGRTSFVIAHRLSTIKNADNILVMEDGKIIEQGNHDELISLNGFYAELYNSQFVA